MGFYPRGRPSETSAGLVLQMTHYKSAEIRKEAILKVVKVFYLG